MLDKSYVIQIRYEQEPVDMHVVQDPHQQIHSRWTSPIPGNPRNSIKLQLLRDEETGILRQSEQQSEGKFAQETGCPAHRRYLLEETFILSEYTSTGEKDGRLGFEESLRIPGESES